MSKPNHAIADLRFFALLYHSKNFTDVSKCCEKVAAAVDADGSFHNLCRLPDNGSTCAAEVHAIYLALKFMPM